MITDAVLDVVFGVLTWIVTRLPEVDPVVDFGEGLVTIFGYLGLFVSMRVVALCVTLLLLTVQVVIIRAGMRAIFR
jgi:hypothetical protein